MNLAPVLDVCPAGQGYFMEKRCLGTDAARVSHLGMIVVREMQRGGLAACVKHFPGLGRAVIDPHLELPVVSSDKASLTSVDLVPFEAACGSNVAACMTSHAIYEQLDLQRPATLSRTIITDILRKTFKYEGLVITDDLEMGAIEKSNYGENAALEAFLAGADLMLICQEHSKVRKALDAFDQALQSGVFEIESVLRALVRQNKVRSQYTA
jgi:beta-N-acetylhexosaminidase